MASMFNAPKDSPDERRRKIRDLELSLWDLFRFDRPWILVPNGSLLGYFDWAPEHLRTGPWFSGAPSFLFALIYLLVMAMAAICQMEIDEEGASDGDNRNKSEALNDDLDVGARRWCLALGGLLWMTLVSSMVYRGPAGKNAWATYTMWSWTMTQSRYAMIVLLPLLESHQHQIWVLSGLQLTRYPSLVMASLTFGVWNFLLFPFIYVFLMETAEKKRNFWKFAMSFRLVQLHVFNIGYAYGAHVLVVEDDDDMTLSRQLRYLWATVAVGVLYVLFYWLVLDRIGVHLYPIFSPRHAFVIITACLQVFGYIGLFCYWNPNLLTTLTEFNTQTNTETTVSPS